MKIILLHIVIQEKNNVVNTKYKMLQTIIYIPKQMKNHLML